MAETEIVGPVDCALLRFSGNRFTGEIVPALQELIANGTVRIIDLVFITKDADGAVAVVELSELDVEARSAYDDLDGDVDEWLTQEDLEQASTLLEPESSAALLMWENLWAARLVDAIRGANGEVLAFARIPREALEASVAELSR